MQRLYVLYDERCGLCRWARHWVEVREVFVPLIFVPAGSDTAKRLFPTLWRAGPPEELVVVSDEGEVYLGGSAWVMVLYALRDYREWALRLGSPVLLPLARQAFATLSRHRGPLSRWLGLDQDDQALRETLDQVVIPPCDLSAPHPPPSPPSRPNPSATARASWARRFAD